MTLRKLTPIIGISLILSLYGCANKNAPVELKPQLQQLEVLHRVQELQRTVIAVHDVAPEKLTKANADIIVKFTLAANDIVAKGETNWQSLVKSSWASLKQSYTPPANLLVIWGIVDSLVGSLR